MPTAIRSMPPNTRATHPGDLARPSIPLMLIEFIREPASKNRSHICMYSVLIKSRGHCLSISFTPSSPSLFFPLYPSRSEHKQWLKQYTTYRQWPASKNVIDPLRWKEGAMKQSAERKRHKANGMEL